MFKACCIASVLEVVIVDGERAAEPVSTS
jgi:hypothetical protein